MVVTAPASPSSLAGPPAQGRSAARSAFDRRSVIRVAPENDVFRLLEHRHAGASCIRRTRSHRRDSHPGRRRFSGHTRSGRYSWARYYHPGLQRFISEDPIGFAGGGTNLYAYVANNPLSFVDPLGLEKQAADEPCRLDMPLTSGWRLPDYLSLNVNFPIPWLSARTDDWVGGTFQVALDREGRLYGGLGPQVGKRRFRASASLTGGMLLQAHKPSKERLEAFMTGHSFNVGVGHGLGGQVTIVPGVCSALEAGLFTPDQFGAAYHYSKQVGQFPVSW